LHQVVHAERAVDEADQLLAPLLQAVRHLALGIHRQIHEKAVLHALVGFLDQAHPPGHRRLAEVASTGHGLAAHRLAEHVVAQGALVAPVEGLQVEDGAGGRALAARPQLEGRQAFAADALDQWCVFGRAQPLAEADALDAGVMLVDPQVAHIVVPFVALDTLRGGEQAHRAAQYLLVGEQALLHGGLHFALRELEALVGDLLLFPFGVAPQAQAQRHAEQRGSHGGEDVVALRRRLHCLPSYGRSMG